MKSWSMARPGRLMCQPGAGRKRADDEFMCLSVLTGTTTRGGREQPTQKERVPQRGRAAVGSGARLGNRPPSGPRQPGSEQLRVGVWALSRSRAGGSAGVGQTKGGMDATWLPDSGQPERLARAPASAGPR